MYEMLTRCGALKLTKCRKKSNLNLKAAIKTAIFKMVSKSNMKCIFFSWTVPWKHIYFNISIILDDSTHAALTVMSMGVKYS